MHRKHITCVGPDAHMERSWYASIDYIDDNDNSFNGALILTVFCSVYLLILVHQNGRVPGKFAV